MTNNTIEPWLRRQVLSISYLLTIAHLLIFIINMFVENHERACWHAFLEKKDFVNDITIINDIGNQGVQNSYDEELCYADYKDHYASCLHNSNQDGGYNRWLLRKVSWLNHDITAGANTVKIRMP